MLFQSQNKVPNIPIFGMRQYNMNYEQLMSICLTKCLFYQILRVGYDSGLIACLLLTFIHHNEKVYLQSTLILNTEITVPPISNAIIY
jgi:hypothetical protein